MAFYIAFCKGGIFIESGGKAILLFISNITVLSYVLISLGDITGCLSVVARLVADSVSFGEILLQRHRVIAIAEGKRNEYGAIEYV
ncbi:TPA: hypothetical protein N2F43_002704 [Salmonella enterica]|nr:hypothetical protein [Salmonella enterica]